MAHLQELLQHWGNAPCVIARVPPNSVSIDRTLPYGHQHDRSSSSRHSQTPLSQPPRRPSGGRDVAWHHRSASPPRHGSNLGWPSDVPMAFAPPATDSWWPSATTFKFPRLALAISSPRKDGSKTKKRIVKINDLFGSTIDVNLWESASKQRGHELKNMSTPAVVLILVVRNARVGYFNGKYEYCKSNQTCGSRNFMFPFGTAHRSCGLPSYQLDCVQNVRPVIGIGRQNYTILQIFYHNKTFKLTDDKYFQDCTFSNPIDATWDSGNSIFNIINVNNASLQVYVCGGKCLPYGSYPPEYHNLSCSPKMVTIPAATVQWSIPEEREQSCRDCEKSKGFCGYSLSNSGNFFICYCQDGPHSKQCSQGRTSKRGVVIGVAIGTAGLLIAVTGLVVCYRNSRPTSDVEQFLHDYVDEMPNRYSYSQLKKITDNFADKLGEGAYGVVYKGRLSSGNMVAVKILDHSRHSEEQFKNEVGTIGRIHHTNLVRLMGYCFEGARSALVYEYMINGSLEKFIFAEKGKEQMLNWDQLYSIALGAARGIAYLHQDCNRRIIHFDIKPHNILLDADFTPKVADFGLAKLCGKEDYHISLTATRGTPGYIAPELWYRNLGPVTDKSDIYSFGMVLLEIVGGRKNINLQASRSSQIYFPEWAFKLIENGELEKTVREVAREGGCIDDEKAIRLTKVGLWCIQHNSINRPTMRRVVQMLEGNGEDVVAPPFPFDSPPSPEAPFLSSFREEASSDTL
ncbi:rust resistance kinase Lr10 [Cryptomeria japonica]|uniref:rust resistance kinase Lr10 n=1 Tax=Cryptomeria japonica TaxID=3369 RepID=UPI0027DA7846|nr:rust resistance kinase Lr10 [Cryptomeria japonica]